MKTFIICVLYTCALCQSIKTTYANAENPVDAYGSQYQYDSDSEDYSQETQQHYHVSKKPNFHDKQGLTSGITDLLGPEAAVSIDAILLSIVGAVLGGAAIVGVLVNNNNISELSKDQDSICTLAKSLGGFTCTYATATAPTNLELKACFDTITAYSTPDCD